MRIGFKMKVFEGKHIEYKKRHENVFPDLEILLKEASVHNYSIF